MAFDDMREVHKRRYLLQPIAVEVFSSDGRNFLLAFPRKTRNKVYDRYWLMYLTVCDMDIKYTSLSLVYVNISIKWIICYFTLYKTNKSGLQVSEY